MHAGSAIVDERNAVPIIQTIEDQQPVVTMGRRAQMIYAPGWDVILPTVKADGFVLRQAYRLVLIGEKTSLADVLRPIACQYQVAEVVLPTGELSTTLLYGVCRHAAADGRPCLIFYLSNFDPTGYHMPVEVSGKLQALTPLYFPDLDLQLRRCALTFEQVAHLGLPSTPTKETERRADRWRQRWGVEQTEIDALSTLRPAQLSRIVRKALHAYLDQSLELRLSKAQYRANEGARLALERVMTAHKEEVETARALYQKAVEASRHAYETAAPLDQITEEVNDLIEPPDLPEPDPQGAVDEPLFDSAQDWISATHMLLEEKL
jgi:hypothetical protein